MSRLARRLSLIGLCALRPHCSIGTVGFTVIDHYPPFDAFYMTLTTMTTVGYGEIHPLSHAGRDLQFLPDLLRSDHDLHRHRRDDPDHHRTGVRRRHWQAAEQTHDRQAEGSLHHLRFRPRGARRRQRIAATPACPSWWWISDPERVERAMLAGMLAVAADSTRDETLRQVGIERARGLVAALATDADNLFVLLSAKGLNPGDLRGDARGRGGRRREDAARRRGRGFRAVLDHRASAGAIAAAAARGAVPGLHHQGRGRGYRHRAGTGGGQQRDGVANHPRDAACARKWA